MDGLDVASNTFDGANLTSVVLEGVNVIYDHLRLTNEIDYVGDERIDLNMLELAEIKHIEPFR